MSGTKLNFEGNAAKAIERETETDKVRVVPDALVSLIEFEKPTAVFSVKVKKLEDLKPVAAFATNIGGKTVAVHIDSKTEFIGKEEADKDDLIFISELEMGRCVVKRICSKKYYSVFSGLPLKRKRELMQWFDTKINPEQRSAIIAQKQGKRYEKVREMKSAYLVTEEDLRGKFSLCRSNYTPQQQSDMDVLFKECVGGNLAGIRKLRYILNINSAPGREISLTKEQIIEGLDRELYKMDSVKEKIAEAIAANKYSKNKGIAILLVGPSGVGKTAIMRAVAKVLDIPFSVIPLSACNSKLDITGDASQYQNSDCGEVVKTFYKYMTTNIVLGLDEFDKSDETKEGNPITAFNDMLSDDHFFKDCFLTTYIDTSNTVIIASANSTESIPSNLLNRFTVIKVDGYSDEEKTHITREFVLPEIIGRYEIDPSLIEFPDSVIRYISENYCEDDGVRDMKKHMESVVRSVVSGWESKDSMMKVTVTESMADRVLGKYVDSNNPTIIYRRNKDKYSNAAASEIEELLSARSGHPEEKEKTDKKLSYLLNLIPNGDAFSNFDADRFYECIDSTHYGQKEVKEKLAKIFYSRSLSGKSVSSIRLLFVGPAGVGKTSIVKSIAKACNAEYAKISLNGVSEDSVIKGHSFSYSSADAGVIVKAASRKKTTKMIMQLDEIDKMGSREGVSASNALIDLLDDSGEFTDHFLGIPCDFSNTMFIATANSLDKVHPLLRDRFTVIMLDGYTGEEKKKIVSDYILPRAVAEYCPDNLHISLDERANELIVDEYCRSVGIRDADEAVRTIVRDKIYEVRNNADVTELTISAQDVSDSLGPVPIERGNYPDTVYPGLSRGLAVSGNGCGMTFAIETGFTSGGTSLSITGLANNVVSESVKLAVNYIKRNYPELLRYRGIQVHFGEGAVPKDGPSAGVAILMSVLSAGLEKPIEENVAYTGEINLNGNVWAIGGVLPKIKAAEKAGCTKVFIPEENYRSLSKESISSFKVEIVPVKHVKEVIDAIFPVIDAQ